MILNIPLKPIPSQSLTISLNGQQCYIKVFSKNDEVFIDLTVNEIIICQGILCTKNVIILPNDSFSFTGILYFTSQENSENPDYTTFGDKWFLQYEY